MKRVIVLASIILVCLLLVGCNKKSTLTCTLNNEKIILTFEKGKIIEYTIDKVKQSESVIEEANQFLNGIKNNKDAIKKMSESYSKYNGKCE